MRFMVMHKVDERMEAGVPPSPELIANMGSFIAAHAKAGVFLGGEGLKPSATRTRVALSGGTRTIQRGPYPGANELVAGCMVIRVPSTEDAMAWVSRYAEVVGDVEVELGPVNEPWDLGVCPMPADAPLRFLVLHKADARSEAGVRPSRRQMAEVTRLTDEMTRAGVLLTAEQLRPSAEGLRLKLSGGQRVVIEGPFAESKELIAGFSILRLPSREAVIELTTRFAEILGGEVEVDVRPMWEPEDIAAGS
jgi:hypothetical protein